MKKTFLLSIALAMCYCSAHSQTIAVTQYEIDALKGHSKEIMEKARYIADEETMRIHMNYRVLRKDEEKLARYIREREIRKCCYDYIFPDSLTHRVVNKMSIDEFYADSVNTILITAGNPYISGENVTFALFRAKDIEIDAARQDTIMEHALAMARRLRRNPKLDLWDEEMLLLTKTLTTRQLDKFFYIRHYPEIAKEVSNCWQRLEEAGLTEELDSAQEVVNARMYYSLRHKITDIFRSNRTARRSNIAELNKQMPTMVRMLEALEKKEKIEDEEKKDKTIGKEFVW
ncbi:MAG: hypothetical protein J5932_03835 [Prevotella sp.]|nr:hypothetical protein [Prevotella sp.]